MVVSIQVSGFPSFFSLSIWCKKFCFLLPLEPVDLPYLDVSKDVPFQNQQKLMWRGRISSPHPPHTGPPPCAICTFTLPHQPGFICHFHFLPFIQFPSPHFLPFPLLLPFGLCGLAPYPIILLAFSACSPLLHPHQFNSDFKNKFQELL